MDAAGVVASVAFGAALVITVLTQRLWHVPGFDRLKAHDPCALIPVWTFFAPNPGVDDNRLLWRERLVDGSTSPWHELCPPRGGLARALWNPTKRLRKAIGDTGPIVARRVAQEPENKLMLLSVPYLMLLNAVASAPRSPLSEARQFMVVRTRGADEDPNSKPQVLLISNWHLLEPPAEAVPAEAAAA